MIREIAIIDVKPGQESEFAAAFRETGYELLANTPGCLSVSMFQSGETPTRFIGVNVWVSQQAHLENFRGTDRYVRYGEALRPYVSTPPVVEHFADVMEG